RLFARMRTRGLTPEQLFDSLALATGGTDSEPTAPAYGVAPFNPATPRADFLRRFPNQAQRPEQQTSIPQALYLMNRALGAGAVRRRRTGGSAPRRQPAARRGASSSCS